jgi:hypothetical protein
MDKTTARQAQEAILLTYIAFIPFERVNTPEDPITRFLDALEQQFNNFERAKVY